MIGPRLLERARHGPVHLVGVGGAGMAGLARVLVGRGVRVTGCDRDATNPALDDLRAAGIAVEPGHDPSHVEGAAAVVVTAAVPADHPEVDAARRRGIPIWRRARALGELVNEGRLVAVAGTHGKTTTTAMTVRALAACGLDPTALVGGRVAEWGGNARLGAGDLYVVEADEYDRAFLELRPQLAVITSVEPEHLDCYRDRDELESAFARFAAPARDGLGLVVCADDAGAARVARAVGGDALAYGLGAGAALRASNVALRESSASFDVHWETRPLGRFELRVPGEHNVRNALAALGAALRYTGGAADLEGVRDALAGFRGVERRFQIVGSAGGVLVVDDYAHHPTEIAATIRAAREGWPDRRVLVCFQPHLYSRTRDFAAEFGRALAAADRAWVLEVYAAREAPIPGVGGAVIAAEARRAGAGPEQVAFVPRWEDAVDEIAACARPGDLCLVLGAGDVWKAARALARRFEQGARELADR